MSFKDRSINAKTSILPFTIGADTSANVTIGNSADVYSVDLRGNTTAGSGTLFFGNTGINGRIEGNTGSLNLGTSSTTTINIGDIATSTINVGNLTVKAQTMNALTPANSLNFGTTQSGILIIGNAANTNRIGSISILNQAINTLDPTVDLTIGTTQTSNIVIGNATYTTKVSNFNFTGQTVNPITPANNMNICTNQTTGTLVIGTAAKPTTLSGNVTCSGTTATTGTLTTNGTLSINSGFNFNTGNLTAGPYFIQTGTYSSTTAIAANGVRSVPITFTTAFKASTTPFVTMTCTDVGGLSLVCSTRSITNSNFSCLFFNSGAVSTLTSTYGINYLAIGEKA
jgi:hypothetical protein